MSTALPAMADKLTLDGLSDVTRNKLIRDCESSSNESGNKPAICEALEEYLEELDDEDDDDED
ncbi:hypothetical protein [Maritalea mediterranea]|uniref:SAP domain-containing protein n=1 Tax=Maritalea mediterranea TaxID=2909667 RepID=A0ABS9E5W1_9HYPH|nr:hypothetical protein [Maritalea mediterranea]MCF4098258.1 hypothetical protein [Maritalea mediterranea]